MNAPPHELILAAGRAEAHARRLCTVPSLQGDLAHLERVTADLDRLTWANNEERAFALATAWLWGTARLVGLPPGIEHAYPPDVTRAVTLLLRCDSAGSAEDMDRVRQDRVLCLVKLADLRARINDQAAAFERLARLFAQVTALP